MNRERGENRTASVRELEPGSIVRVFASDDGRLLWPTSCECSAVALTGRLWSFMSSERTSRRLLMTRPWTVEEDAVVLELFRRGKSPVTIAGKLRRTLSAVRSRKNKLLAAQGGDIGTGSRASR